jgi:hypothetical protein
MTKRRIGLTGVILLMLVIGVWVVWHKHSGPSGYVASGPGTEIPVHASQVPGASAAAKSVEMPHAWSRPSAKTVGRNLRRIQFALLQRLGASDNVLNRITDGDALAVIGELNERARRGDPSAANMLEYMARINCAFARINGEGSESQSSQLLNSQALPAPDREFLRTAIQEQNASNRQLVAACQAIDQKEVEGWVATAAAQGNAASLYLRWRFRGNQSLAVSQQQLQDAVDAGYPEAQATLAQRLTGGSSGLPPGGEGAETLFKEAEASLPYAESLLALCEFTGCPGIAADIPSAVAHAREAAQRGALDAMIQIGPQLQASQIDPNEVAAWNLVGAMLAQQGCSYGGLSVQWLKNSNATLTSNRMSANAKALADQYWRDFGAQMMGNIGCAS